MENKVVLLDTSVLIDYFRKKDKSKTRFLQIADHFSAFKISVITEYEIYSGSGSLQADYWNEFLRHVSVIPLDSFAVQTAVKLNNDLKRTRNQIDIADLFIAATAVSLNIPVCTLNKRHFDRIESLQLV